MIIEKKKLIIIIPSIRYDQVMSKTYNTRSQNVKILVMIKNQLTNLEIN